MLTTIKPALLLNKVSIFALKSEEEENEASAKVPGPLLHVEDLVLQSEMVTSVLVA